MDSFFIFLKIERKLGGISESQISAMVLREVSRGVSLSATELNRRVKGLISNQVSGSLGSSCNVIHITEMRTIS